MQLNKYTDYRAVDFLQDEDFLRWQIFMIEDDVLYWAQVSSGDSRIAAVIEEAKILYKTSIRFNDYSLSPSDVVTELDTLQGVIAQRKHIQSRRRIIYLTAAAACIAVITIVTAVLLKPSSSEIDIKSFAQALPTADFRSTDTRLVLSDDKTVTLTSLESSITYDTNGILVDDIHITKDGVSTYNQLITPYGKRSKITLSDGSTAWVNAGSKLVYPTKFNTDKRELYVDGEIYLEVVHDSSRPFIVRTEKMAIEVLGTKFNIAAHAVDSENTVALLSGSVGISLDRHDKQIVLKPDQLYSLREGAVSIRTVDASSFALWTQGLYHFNSEQLGSILTRLERYYGVVIACEPSISGLNCSGKLDFKDDLNTLLADLTRALSVTYTRNTDGSYTIQKS